MMWETKYFAYLLAIKGEPGKQEASLRLSPNKSPDRKTTKPRYRLSICIKWIKCLSRIFPATELRIVGAARTFCVKETPVCVGFDPIGLSCCCFLTPQEPGFCVFTYSWLQTCISKRMTVVLCEKQDHFLTLFTQSYKQSSLSPNFCL